MLPEGIGASTKGGGAGSHSIEDDLTHVIDKLDSWIDELIVSYADKRISCLELKDGLGEYYPDDFLGSCYYVVVDQLPFPEIKEAQTYKHFFDEDDYYLITAITYKDTYFILKNNEYELSTHFHELVHVQQWKVLGSKNFLSRYLSELRMYENLMNLPIEKMAYELELKFKYNQQLPNLLESIRRELLNDT